MRFYLKRIIFNTTDLRFRQKHQNFTFRINAIDFVPEVRVLGAKRRSAFSGMNDKRRSGPVKDSAPRRPTQITMDPGSYDNKTSDSLQRNTYLHHGSFSLNLEHLLNIFYNNKSAICGCFNLVILILNKFLITFK